MVKSNPKKKHHYIPVFYLKNFTDKNGCLYAYDKYGGPILESSPEGIAYENHYFSFVQPNGEKDSETVENYIMLLEDKFAPVVKKIHNFENLNFNDRITFSFFVASMMVRIPNMRDNIRKSTGEMIKKISIFMATNKDDFERRMRKFEEDTGKRIGMDVEKLRQHMKNPENYDVTVDKQYAIGMALSLMEGFAKVFFQMKWGFIKATDEYKYITGDSPLEYIDPTHNPKSFYGVGLANKNIEVSLPLSKEICAFGSWKHREGYMQAQNNHVKYLNRMTAIASEKFIFADKRSKYIDKFVKKYKGSHRIMTVG